MFVDKKKLQEVPDSNIGWSFIGKYLGEFCEQLVLAYSPEVIVWGGGIMNRTILFEKICEHLVRNVKYPVDFSGNSRFKKPFETLRRLEGSRK